MKKKRIVVIGILSLFLILTLGSEIQAISWCDGRINVKGSIRHQSVFRADDLQKDFEHIQARTTMRLETLIDISDRIGFLENVTFYGTLEPYYDAVFDMYSDNKTWGGAINPNYPDKTVGF